jgi:hypothetical protein
VIRGVRALPEPERGEDLLGAEATLGARVAPEA